LADILDLTCSAEATIVRTTHLLPSQSVTRDGQDIWLPPKFAW